jgi:ABC-type lipoprotein export system ATPase subunit
MSELLISTRGVTKAYQMGRRRVTVLRELNFDVAPGEFVALRGASGAGKSTLLHLLGGLDTPDRGEIWFAGENLASLSGGELARVRNSKIGFVFQSYHLVRELDALENVCLPARIARVPSSTAEERGRELLTRVGLEDRLEHLPAELSGGERQRVAIARALVNQPDLILADEPTGNLDSHTGGEIIDLLCSLREERQVTLVIATHDASVASRAPKVVSLIDGRIQV